MGPQVVPLVHVRSGAVVRAAGPRRWDPLTRTEPEAVARIKGVAPPDGLVYVYDVDGVEAGAPSLDFYQRLERARVPLWLHTGCRTPEDAMDAFFAGAQALTIERRHMNDGAIRELAELAEGEIHLMLPFQGRAPRPDLRAFELQRFVQANGLSGIVLRPEPPCDGHALNAYAGDVRHHGAPTSLFLAPDGPTIDPEGNAFDRIIGGNPP